MEANVAKGLTDKATLAELAVLALYAQAITKLYTRQIRAPGTEGLNILNMGPLHENLILHISTLIKKPSLLLYDGPDAYLVTAFDRCPWDDPLAIQSVLHLYRKGKLPHLESLLTAFLKGALETWKRFTEEFAPGGLIATSTAEECDLASMPTTNDANEGMLGSWRQHSRAKPSLTAGHFTDQVMFSRNNTQDFMDELFTEEDDAYLRKEARRVDTLGIAKHQRRSLVERGRERAEAARQKAVDRAAKAAKTDSHFLGLTIIVDPTEVTLMRDEALRDQIELHRRLGLEKNIPKKSQLQTKKQRFSVLMILLSRYEAREQGEVVIEDIDFLSSDSSGCHDGDNSLCLEA